MLQQIRVWAVLVMALARYDALRITGRSEGDLNERKEPNRFNALDNNSNNSGRELLFGYLHFGCRCLVPILGFW